VNFLIVPRLYAILDAEILAAHNVPLDAFARELRANGALYTSLGRSPRSKVHPATGGL
jgi:hypothetical protein